MQTILPLIPEGSSQINDIVSVLRQKDVWIYFLGAYPVYQHDAADHNHFRLIIAQLVDSGACRPCQLIATFGISKNKVLRATKQLRECGVASFFSQKGGKKKEPS